LKTKRNSNSLLKLIRLAKNGKINKRTVPTASLSFFPVYRAQQKLPLAGR
jgi:hypothetical protein